jgi:hypothetical protein
MKLNWLKRASLCAALLGGSFYTYDLNFVNAQNAPAAEPLMEQKYKNIQALKGVPASQMRPLMNLISASLGMKCDECHVKMAIRWSGKKTTTITRPMPAK